MRLSVIIPTFNEAANIAATLANVRAQHPHEILVVDGDSSDATVRLAEPAADRVLLSVRGRAAQMNLGAALATGDAFLFLHADCTLAPGGIAEAVHLLTKRHVAGGCFSMGIPHPHPLYRSIAYCATARVRLFGIVYGDQGLFVQREMFNRAGGFPHQQLMEDVALSLRLRKLGHIVVSRKRIHVSPRRWQQTGIVRQTLWNWGLTVLAAGGVPPNRLARYYPALR